MNVISSTLNYETLDLSFPQKRESSFTNKKQKQEKEMLVRIFYSIVISTLLAGLLVPLAGCAVALIPAAILGTTASQIAGGLGESYVKPAEKVNFEQPLKIGKEKAAGIKKIVVFSQTGLMQKAAPEDLRIQVIMERLLIAELEKNGKLQIVTPAVFQQKQKELGLEINPAVMTKSEIAATFSKIVTALDCDAVIGIVRKMHKVGMGKGLATYVLMGRVSFNFTMILGVSDRSGADVWQQELDYSVSEGELTRHNITADELNKAFAPIVKTLADDFFKSIGHGGQTIAETKS